MAANQAAGQIFGHVRQLVDSLSYKEEVRGSSPFVPTNDQSRVASIEWRVSGF